MASPPIVYVSVIDYAPPQMFIYKHLRWESGPLAESGREYDLNTDSSLSEATIFEYEVPEGQTVDLTRLNFIITGWGAIHPNNFAGIEGGLTNGSLLQIVDIDSNVLLDFNDGVPIKTNDQFAKLSGVDSVAIDVGNGDDWFPIRFTVRKAGKKMRLTEGQRVRWTNLDDLKSIKRFQIMAQGVLFVPE